MKCEKKYADTKRILMVYPHNLNEHNSGINMRFKAWTTYFKSRGYTVDQLGLLNFESNWNDVQGNKEYPVDNLFLFDHEKLWAKQRNDIIGFIKRVIKRLSGDCLKKLPDFAFPELKERFSEIIRKNEYDIVLISYVYWAGLLDIQGLENVFTILELSDYLTLNLCDSTNGKVKFQNLLNEEMRRINQFDNVICISNSEYRFFLNACPSPKFHFVPMFMDRQVVDKKEKEFDVLFVGSSNKHNQKSIKWFIENVKPLLMDLKILVVGSIVDCFPDIKEVTKIRYAERLEEIYAQVKCAVAPFFGGTGMKIKVIEALAHSVPIVSTTNGLEGIPGEYSGKLLWSEQPEEFAGLIKRLVYDRSFSEQQIKIQDEIFSLLFTREKIYRQLDEIFLGNVEILKEKSIKEKLCKLPIRCFLHIPKTGSSSLGALLKKQYGKSVILDLYSSDQRKKLNQMNNTTTKIKLIKGHIYFGIHKYFNKPFLYFTFLREPVDRIISFYYCVKQTPKHYLYNIIVDNKLTIKQCIEQKLTIEMDNFQVRALSGIFKDRKFGEIDSDLLEMAKYNLDNHFCFVGFQESYSRDFKKLSRMMGWPHRVIKKNITTIRSLKGSISEDDMNFIVKNNQMDIGLYDYARRKAGYIKKANLS